MTTLGRRWFTAFYIYVQHDFIASVIASVIASFDYTCSSTPTTTDCIDTLCHCASRNRHGGLLY
jgi:hypothetical protein